ncbi:MAG: peptidoglycan DD-metalloendopeptidase family protein [Pseudomonadales bacterium]|nr:peptidoglycan DD-metalloendopeptidase family protein [Pseudomonadales bacterium]
MTLPRDNPRRHLLAASLFGTILVLVGVIWPDPDAQPDASTLADDLDLVIGPAVSVRPEPAVPRIPDATHATPRGAAWRDVEVRPGDSLARIFSRERLPARDLHAVMQSDETTRRLRRIHPGEKLQYRADDAGNLLALRYEFDRLEAIIAERSDAGEAFETRVQAREPERRTITAEAVINNSLFLASTAAGLDDRTAMGLADIFQWDVDFVLDIRRGDAFKVVLEELWLDGERLGYGAILGAEFRNQGEVFRAVRYTDREGYTSYYTPDGMSMRKAFLRAPVQFSRISSNFNMRRRHPLHNTVRPHRGIDYAAPTGTPVVAAGDGRVVRVEKNHHASGNYVVIQHGETYQTKYLHLSRFARGMRNGQRVNQGDVIGYVGATGWATGPHLHYEFLVHGVHKNPRTVDLPKAMPIDEDERLRFQAATGALVALMERSPDTQQIALAPIGAPTGG